MAITSWTQPDTRPREFDPTKLLSEEEVTRAKIEREEKAEKERIANLPSRPIQSFVLGAVDSALFTPKVTDFITGGTLKNIRNDLAKKNPTAALLGNIAGYVVPGTLATKAVKGGLKAGTKLGLRAGAKGFKGISETTKTISRGLKSSKALRYGVEETLAGSAIGLTQGVIEGESGKDIAKRVALEAGIGGVLGTGFGKVADVFNARRANKAIDNMANEVSDRFKVTRSRLQEIKRRRIEAQRAAEELAEPVTRTADDIRTDIENIRTRAETDISGIKSEMKSGNRRKREINKVKRQRNREIEKLNKELRDVGEKDVTIEEPRKPAPRQQPETTTKKPAPRRESISPEQAEIERKVQDLKTKFAKERQIVEQGNLSPEDKSKQLKGMGLRQSAEIRKVRQGEKLIPVEGGLTSKELNDKIKRLKSNYVGKEVLVDGKAGTIEKNVFGDVMVKFDDGTTAKVDRDKVVSRVDVDKLIAEQTQEALSVRAKQPSLKVKQEPRKPVRQLEQAKRKILPKSLRVKGVTFEPKTTQNSSAANIIEQTKQAVGDKPSYKGEKRLSRFRQKTMLESDITPKKLEDAINQNKLTYNSVENQKDWNFAKGKVDSNFKEELSKFRDTQKRHSSIDTMRGEALFVKALQQGDLDLANEISSELSLRLTQAGQEIQAAAFFKKLTPEGMVMYQQKLANKVNANLEEVAEKQFKNIKPKKGTTQGVFKVEDMVDDIGWLKGFLDDMNKTCKL